MKSGRSKVIDIIMTRDDLDIMTASEMVDECIDMMMEAIENEDYTEVDQILADQLGLEPDYVIDLIEY